jgi:hypothetical protein
MKKDFMWYFTTIWLIIGGLGCFLEWANTGDSSSFWGVALVVPSVIWLLKKGK